MKMPLPDKDIIQIEEKIMELATEVFGDLDKAAEWITTPIKVLNDKTPSSRLENAEGIEEVKSILRKIETGEFT